MSTDEILQQIRKAALTEINSKYPHLTYEAGIIAALEWIAGKTTALPMS